MSRPGSERMNGLFHPLINEVLIGAITNYLLGSMVIGSMVVINGVYWVYNYH